LNKIVEILFNPITFSSTSEKLTSAGSYPFIGAYIIIAILVVPGALCAAILGIIPQILLSYRVDYSLFFNGIGLVFASFWATYLQKKEILVVEFYQRFKAPLFLLILGIIISIIGLYIFIDSYLFWAAL